MMCGSGVPAKSARLAALGQVNFDEVAMFAAHLDKGIDRLNDAGAFGPAAAHTPGEGDDSHGTVGQGVQAQIAPILRQTVRCRR